MNGGPPSMASMGGVAPPPPPSMMHNPAAYGAYVAGNTGAFSEQMAGRMVSGARMAGGLASAGIAGMSALGTFGLGGSLGAAATMMSPGSAAFAAGAGMYGMAGGGMVGLGAAGLAAGAVAAPLYAGAAWAGGLAKNFTGGMQDQMGLNANLRQNFNFMGGQGAFGRGFSQGQMGQIGSMVGSEVRNNLFTSAGEMNSVIAGGAQMGQFTGVRDVEQFSKKFKEMLTTLKTVQKELGGNLTEALEFVNSSRAAGVFGNTAVTKFASTVRAVSASTGFDQQQLVQLASQGAQISRSVGGRGEQGAIGAMRGLSTISTALQTGAISEGMLSEATGGRTGQDAMQMLVSDTLQRSGRFSRTAAGRYSIFGLSNAQGTGLDAAATMGFISGDMGVGELRSRAHHNVGSMGRAAAVNREGLLRGALMEQGGMAGQIGMMRMMVGERAMDGGDDLMSLVMQRRLHMSRPQAEVMTSLMRNQGAIASREASDAASSSREVLLRTDIKERRSLDAFTRHLEHSVEDSTKMLAARDMGRNFVTRISSLGEKLLNDMLGISSDQMNSEGQKAMGRLRQGSASRNDFKTLGFGEGSGGSRAFNAYSQGMLETGPSIGQRLSARGMRVGGTMEEVAAQMNTARMADMGIVSGTSDLRALAALQADPGSATRFVRARTAAGENPDDIFRNMGGSGNAVAAYAAQNQFRTGAAADGSGRLLGRGGGSIGWQMWARDAARVAGIVGVGVATGGAAGAGLSGAGAAMFLDRGSGSGGRSSFMQSEVLHAMRQDHEGNALDFIASGGHVAETEQRLRAGIQAGAVQRGLATLNAGERAAYNLEVSRNSESFASGTLQGGRDVRAAALERVMELRTKLHGSDGAPAGGSMGNSLIGDARAANARTRQAMRLTAAEARQVQESTQTEEQLTNSQVTKEDITALRGNQDIMSRMREAMGAQTPEQKAAAMERLNRYVATLDPTSKEGMAAARLSGTMSSSLLNTGSFGREHRLFVQESGASRAAEQARGDYIASLQTMGARGGGAIGRSQLAMAALMVGGPHMVGEAGHQRMQSGSEYREELFQAQAAGDRLTIGPSASDFQTWAENAMNSTAAGPQGDRERAEARQEVLRRTRIRAEAKNLSGEGRRGAQGAYEAALGKATGYGASGMSFDIGTGRRQRHVGGRQAQQMLQRALSGEMTGAAREQVLAGFEAQATDAEGMGLTRDQAGQMRNILVGMNESRRREHRRGFSDEEQGHLNTFLQSPGVAEAQEAANARRASQALSSASARDPVGAAQLSKLTEIAGILSARLKAPEGHEDEATGTSHA